MSNTNATNMTDNIVITTVDNNNNNNTVEPSQNECPICYETIPSTNNLCTTPCGHSFCFKCMVKCLQHGNTCPCCREILQEDMADEEDTEDEDDDDDDDDFVTEDEDEDDDDAETLGSNDTDEDDPECSVEYIEKILKEKNVTYLNLLSLLICRFPKNTSLRVMKKTEKNVFDIVNNLDNDTEKEMEEISEMEKEDTMSKNTETIKQVVTEKIEEMITSIVKHVVMEEINTTISLQLQIE
jgi:hypothetical protein